MPHQGADIFTAVLHFLFRPKALTAPFDQQRRDSFLDCPAIKPVPRSGADPIWNRKHLGSGLRCTVDRIFTHCRDEDQRTERFITVPAMEIHQ